MRLTSLIGILAASGFLFTTAFAQDLSFHAVEPTAKTASMLFDQPSLKEGDRVSKTDRTLWWTSVAALSAATLADAHSSWGKYEGNSVLAGTTGKFGTRGAMLKVGVTSGWVAAQAVMLRKSRSHRVLAIINFAAATAFSIAACHNYGITYTVR